MASKSTRSSFAVKASPFVKQKADREERKKVDQEQAAHVFEEFVAAFSNTDSSSKTFVRGSTINPETKEETASNKPGSVYRPVHKLLEAKRAAEAEAAPSRSPVPSTSTKPQKKKEKDKAMSVLEMFREELRKQQEEREERKKMKRQGLLPIDAPDVVNNDKFLVQEYDTHTGSHDTGNPLTTNLYIGNISPKMNEEMLCQTFGKFGPLASVKVMWPRTEEERQRKKNCGFVAFMKREDGEQCLEEMKDAEIMGYQIQIGWGKAVPIPPNPIYVPPNMKEMQNATEPDPPSGLPFNAQPKRGVKFNKEDSEKLAQMLHMTTVRVVIPKDKEVLQLIHRMIEFVIREGPMLEAIIMHKEMNNPKFSFLFQNQSPEHVYYRWKLFSILNGDSPETWRTDELRMFEGGSLWKPPPLKNLLSMMIPPVEDIVKKGQLSAKHREELEELLRNITMERASILNALVWCMEHADGAQEIVECITEALCIDETPMTTKLARLYLVNDILQNTTSKQSNLMSLKRGFESRLQTIFEHFHKVHQSMESKSRAEAFRRRSMLVLRALQEQSVFHWDFMTKMRTTFIGHSREEMEKKKAFEMVASLMNMKRESGEVPDESGDVDGVPLDQEEEDIDGIPMDFSKPIDFSRTLTHGGGVSGSHDDDLDGIPMDDDLDGEPMEAIPLSKEDSPRENQVSSGPVVKSKWDDTEEEEESENKLPSAGTTLGQEVDMEKRKKMREVEMKVLELVDALEATQSYRQHEVQEKAEKFRQKLLKEIPESTGRSSEESSTRNRSLVADYGRSPSPEAEGEDSKHQSDKRGRSSQRSRSRSPSRGKRRSRSRSPSSRSHSSPRSKRRRSRSPPSRHRSSRRSRSRSGSPPRRSRSKR